MFGRWCIKSFPELVWIEVNHGGGLPADVVPLAPEKAIWRLREWFPDGDRTLCEIHHLVAHPAVSRPELDFERLREGLAEALRRGILRVYHTRDKLSGRTAENKVEPPNKQPPPTEKKDWIAISLVDDDTPPKPVPYAKYRIELPDNTVREGMLDENGRARIRDIDPGTCKVSFPQFHGPDWDAA